MASKMQPQRKLIISSNFYYIYHYISTNVVLSTSFDRKSFYYSNVSPTLYTRLLNYYGIDDLHT